MNIEERFSQLLAKHCLGTSTPVDELKLAKLQTLRANRNPRSKGEIRNDTVAHFKATRAIKVMGAIAHLAGRQKPLPAGIANKLGSDLLALL